MAEFQVIDEYPFEVCLLPREKALTFADYLNSIGIRAVARSRDESPAWAVAVANESDVSRAKIELVKYAGSPYDQKYTQASWTSGRYQKAEKRLSGGILASWNPLTMTSVIELICVLFYLAMFVSERSVVEWFSLTRAMGDLTPENYYRLLTPVFLHFNIVHIAFNLVMWEALARPLERTLGLGKLFSLFIAVALMSNVLQYMVLDGNGTFGGLSGVVYGVIGYMGLISRRSDCPQSLQFPQGLLAVSAVFIVFGFFVSGIANFCHLGGLLVGLAWGFLDYKRPIFSK